MAGFEEARGQLDSPTGKIEAKEVAEAMLRCLLTRNEGTDLSSEVEENLHTVLANFAFLLDDTDTQ